MSFPRFGSPVFPSEPLWDSDGIGLELGWGVGAGHGGLLRKCGKDLVRILGEKGEPRGERLPKSQYFSLHQLNRPWDRA